MRKESLRFVKSGSALVKNDALDFSDHGTGQGNSLALTTGKIFAVLRNDRIQSVKQGTHIIF